MSRQQRIELLTKVVAAQDEVIASDRRIIAIQEEKESILKEIIATLEAKIVSLTSKH